VDEFQPPLEIFSPYKPLYFVVGATHSKFEISFKAQVVSAAPIYFAYTQTSFWDLFKASVPFVDTIYSPEIFYRMTLNQSEPTWLDVGGQHESNGRDGDASRAWNRIYARYTSVIPTSGRSRIYWSAQAWIPFVTHDESVDMVQYRGLYEINVTWSNFLGEGFEKDDLSFRFYPGGTSYLDPIMGGQEIILRLKSKDRKFLPLFVFEMFHGYGETLLDYKQDVWVARAGVGF
jgi:outer membrane phospholipase A